MLKHTRCSVLAYAALCILAAQASSSQQIATNTTTSAASKKVAKLETRNSIKHSNRTLTMTSELKRLSSIVHKAEKAQVGVKLKTAQDKKVALREEEASKKFQPRMMAPAGSEQVPNSSGNLPSAALSQQVAQTHESYYSDSWNPHSLVPTFTDQEQGDEMVALASGDSAGGSETVVGPQAHYQQVKVTSSAGTSSVVQPNSDDSIDGNKSSPSAKQPGDEYYGDDDDEEEDQQQQGASQGPHSKQPATVDHQQHYESKFTSPYNDDPSFSATNGETMGPLEDPIRVNGSKAIGEEKQPSVAAAGVSSAEGGGWLPATSAIGHQHHHYQQHAEQQYDSNLKQPTRSASTEKLIASLFNRNQEASSIVGSGGGGAYSKTGAAIEYLRNMLKSKQSAGLQNQTSATSTTNTTTITGETSIASIDNQQQQQQQQADKQTASLHRLTSIASRLSQMLNNTVKEMPSLQQEQQQPSKRVPEAKFSVDDAKAQTPTLELIYSAPSSSKIQSTTTTTTRLPADESRQTQTPSVETIYPTQVQSAGDLPYAILSQSDPTAPSLSMMPNGTPLGGDYIESMDEFPRGAQQQQLYGSESSVMSVRQPLSPADQLRHQFKLQQDAAVAKDLGLSQVPSQGPPPAQQQVAPAVVASKQQTLEQQQVQQVTAQDHLDVAFQRQLMSIPNSPKYFQLAQTKGDQLPAQVKGRTIEQAPQSKPLPKPLQLPTIEASKGDKQVTKQQQVVVAVTNKTEQQSRKEVQAQMEQQQQQSLEPRRPAIKQQPVPPSPLPPQLLPPATATQYYPQEPQVQHQQTSKQLISNKLYQYQQQEQQAEYQPQAPIQSPAPVPQVRHQQQYSNHKSPQAHNYQPQPQHHYNHHHHQQQQPQQPQSIHQQPLPPPPPPPPMSVHRPSPIPKKQPKIVSYNYFESPNDPHESDIMATNYQLGDALYTSTGGLEHLLSQQELEAIQNQFSSADHSIVPMQSSVDRQLPPSYGANTYDPAPISRPPSHSMSRHYQPQHQQPQHQPSQPIKQQPIEETMRELASTEDQVSVLAPQPLHRLPLPAVAAKLQSSPSNGDSQKTPLLNLDGPNSKSSSSGSEQKKKNLIVYLNHPRPSEMSTKTTDQAYNLAQSALNASPTSADNGTPFDSFISAKEYDGNGLSKESKQLDITNLGELKDGQQDKEGLSVVVIGDAYKYKKIVLLISSKSGGLKFIPMVKDMK